jgi:hypothetical protein
MAAAYLKNQTKYDISRWRLLRLKTKPNMIFQDGGLPNLSAVQTSAVMPRMSLLPEYTNWLGLT